MGSIQPYLQSYLVLGLGIRGGYPHWNDGVRTAYSCLFPIHELLFRTIKVRWVKSFFKSELLWLVVLLFGVWAYLEGATWRDSLSGLWQSQFSGFSQKQSQEPSRDEPQDQSVKRRLWSFLKW